MLLDLVAVEENHEFHCDICVIGAGIAGLVVARTLEGSGLSVFVAESGGLRYETDVEDLNRGEVIGLPHSGVRGGRARGLGGTTRLWGGQLVRYDASDLEVRPWVPHSGWPLTIGDLDPYYGRAAPLFGVEADRFSLNLWDEFSIREPGLSLDSLSLGHTVVPPIQRLGLKWRRHFRLARDVSVLLHATVTRLMLDESGRLVERAVVRSLTGKTARVHARAFALCCGGIENARLLLTSDKPCRKGIGNEHDVVGRFFQDHPVSNGIEVLTDRPAELHQMFGVFSHLRTRYYPRLKLTVGRQRSDRVLNCAALIVPDHPGRPGVDALLELLRAVRRLDRPPNLKQTLHLAARGVPVVAGIGISRLKSGRPPRWRPRVNRLLCIAEQAPDPASRITLSRSQDRLGIPLPVIDWRLNDLDMRTIEVMIAHVRRALATAGLGALKIGATTEAGALNHHIGTTRMSEDPRVGVVNRDAKVHGVANLFVAGSSVFPTGGVANPTFTIAAMSIRLGDHLRRMYRQ